MSLTSLNIGIIGVGNIGGAIATGLIRAEGVHPSQIGVIGKGKMRSAEFVKQGCSDFLSSSELCRWADVIILAVKPHHSKAVLQEVSGSCEGKIFISTVTGLSLKQIDSILDKTAHSYLAMPNTAISIQESMTCIATHDEDEERKSVVQRLFDELGLTLFLEEELMQGATVLAACGTAFALRYIRAQSQAGTEIGFGAKNAQLIAAQTVKGAASLLLKNNSHPENEIDKVTTPQGCTIAGLNEMEHQGFSSALIKGVITSYKKINDISQTTT